MNSRLILTINKVVCKEISHTCGIVSLGEVNRMMAKNVIIPDVNLHLIPIKIGHGFTRLQHPSHINVFFCSIKLNYIVPL